MIHFTANGEFIAIRVRYNIFQVLTRLLYFEVYEHIGLKSEILKDEELAKKVARHKISDIKTGSSIIYACEYKYDLLSWSYDAITAFETLCTKYNMNECEWLIMKKKDI